MSSPKLKVVLTRRLPDAVETRMRELFDAELNLKDRPMERAALEATPTFWSPPSPTKSTPPSSTGPATS
jgi:hypothetical protein